MSDEIEINEATTDTLNQIVRVERELAAQRNLILRTLCQVHGVDPSDYSVSRDFSRLIKNKEHDAA